ncbi:ABC transporter substrate-binding protein [Streptoalloteichus hindustanus]|uniref:Peptide/nickel transport system substrate-binding protein n=1 Tax=Streptoalloteichus hindustanus TaxID=2017 RepID=A0A1M4VNW1_STRHI|nr:ABC transporter substrate-binding protein [Streptoalloteichus hindustanus]SHE70726.1 peptide/nickel transport system substrate-binding protein [Streptoalloteichus hindustanus]
MVNTRTAAWGLRRLATVGLAGAVALSMAACAQSQRGNTDGGAGGKVGGTLTFGSEGAPKLFDPFYATDGPTFRIAHQMFEGLTGFKPGTAEIAPALAEKWEHTPDGRTWTFQLRKGVRFHDGTEFDADAVCRNFKRMSGQTGAGQSSAVSQYWVDNFGGFADGAKPSLFRSCTPKDKNTAVIELTRSTSKFPGLLGLKPFVMQSPTALEKYDANNVRAQGDSFSFPEYALQHPTGTGAFKFGKYDKANNTIELVRFDDYWGGKTKLDKLVYKIIPDETARKQELQSGAIDGYDYPAPADWAQLEKDGFQVLKRPAFNIMYLGFTQKNNDKLRDLKVRQAIAHAVNREQLVKTQLPDRAQVASQFFPDAVDGYNKDLKAIPHDPEKARQLLAEAGATGLAVNFYWPSEVTRPYMPNPKDIFGAIKADLEKVGLKVNAVTKPWNGGYLEDVDQAKADLFLLGWTGDQNTPDNFIGTFFGDPTNRFHTGSASWGQQLSGELKAADEEPDAAKRTRMYQDLNKKLINEYLPAVPLSHSPPAVVFRKDVKGFTASPLTSTGESFAPVSKG